MNEWISVKERNPEESGEYLVTVTSDDCDEFGNREQVSMVIQAWYNPDKGVIFPNKGWMPLNEFYNMADYIVPDIVAWMPLPKPYEGGAENA